MKIAIHEGYEKAEGALREDDSLGFAGKRRKRRKGKKLRGAQRKFAARAKACGRKARRAKRGKWSKSKFRRCMAGKR